MQTSEIDMKDSFITIKSINISQKKIKSIPNGQKIFEYIQNTLKKHSSMALDYIPFQALKMIQSYEDSYYCPKGVIFEELDSENYEVTFQKRIQSL